MAAKKTGMTRCRDCSGNLYCIPVAEEMDGGFTICNHHKRIRRELRTWLNKVEKAAKTFHRAAKKGLI